MRGIIIKITGYECRTVQEAGWSGKENGERLALAERANFEVLITVDQNIRHQQNLVGRKIALVIIHARSNRLADLRQHFPKCLETLKSIQPGTVVEVGSSV